MGRKASIDVERVAAAARELEQRGLPVTVRAMRELLGSGSNTTIATLYKASRTTAMQPAAVQADADDQGLDELIDLAEAASLARAETTSGTPGPKPTWALARLDALERTLRDALDQIDALRKSLT